MMNQQEVNPRQVEANEEEKREKIDKQKQNQNNLQTFLARSSRKVQPENPIIKETQVQNPLIKTDELKKQKNEANQEDDISETVDEQVAGFHIIGQDATNQVLQVNLYPSERIFVRGKILYANFDYKSMRDYAGYQDIYQFLRQFIGSGFHPMRKVHNKLTHLCYFGISKAGGKLLEIDNDIYGDDICIHPGKIILSNVNYFNSSIKNHPNLTSFQNRIKIGKKDRIEKTLNIIQSKNNNIIIEKYLGPKQKFFVEQKLILALSSTVKAKRSIGGLFTAKLEGPGWVFVENESNSFLRENKLLVLLLLIILVNIMFILFDRNK